MQRADGLILTRDEAVAAAYLIRYGVDEMRRRNGAVSAGAVRLAEQLTRFARETTDGQASAIAETANPAAAAGHACSPQITVTAAARFLGVSAQAVRAWCRSGDLIARQALPGGPWTIDERSARALAASRTAGE